MSSTPSLLTEEERACDLPGLLQNGWKLVVSRDAISKEFLFHDFKACFSFMTTIGALSEQKNHHPEWFNVYNRLEITWSTHDCSGLSKLDIELAKFCDEQFVKHIS